MQPTFPYAGRTYAYDSAAPIDISLPLAPGENQVNCFWAEPVQFDTIRVGSFVGSVALGGSTNYQRVHLTPHGNGTHTECYGHISPDPAVTLNQCLRRFLFVARLVSVAPRPQPRGCYALGAKFGVWPLLGVTPAMCQMMNGPFRPPTCA